MVIKINYNILSILAAVVLFICLTFADFAVDIAQPTVADTGVELPVIMYHHILEDKSRMGDYVISPQQLEDDLKFLEQRGYTTISTAQLVAFLEDGTALPDKPVMITFDDGYESVYKYAYPILKAHNMKAVVSIIGRYTDQYSKEGEPKHINYSHLTWSQLEEMQQSGVFDIQNHSYNMHANGKNADRYGIRIKPNESDEVYRENLTKDLGSLTSSIEQKLGVRPQAFAYPFGALCKQSKPILKELGFKVIFTCEEKLNTIYPNTDLPVGIRRINRASKFSTANYFGKFGIK